MPPPLQHQHLHRTFTDNNAPPHRTWMFPLFECRNLHQYLCAMVFPCVPMNTVRRLLQRQYSEENHDFETVSAGVLSSIPCALAAMSFNRQVAERLLWGVNKEEEEGYLWNMEEAHEEAEAEVKRGRLKVAAACVLYPLLVCPMTCWLRRRVIQEAEIDSESLWQSGQVALCCGPCALVQMEDELQGDTYEARGMQHSLQQRMSF
jgi:hypothetical protein